MNEAPREKLCELIARDTSLCDEPLRMEGLLRDLCPHNRREVNVLILALRERIAADLQSSSSAVPIEIVISRLAKRLEDQHSVTREMARWAVESWALALGTISLAQLSVPKEEESARTSRRATSSAQKTPAQSLATPYPTSATSGTPNLPPPIVRSPRLRLWYLLVAIPIALVIANRDKIPGWWTEVFYRKPTQEWVRVISLEKAPGAFPNGRALSFQVEMATVLRGAPGEAHVIVNGTATVREPLYEISPLEDSALGLQDELRLLRSTSKRATALRQRGGVDVSEPDLSGFTFLREATSTGHTARFQFEFKATRDGTTWRMENVLAANIIPSTSLPGKPLGDLPATAAILDSDKANRDKSELAGKIDTFAASVIDAEETTKKRFAAEGRDPGGAPLFPQDRAMPGERFPETRMRILEPAELQAWSEENLHDAVNELFARHGAQFGNGRLSASFSQFDWYHPQPNLSFDQIEASLPDIERQNVKSLGYMRMVKHEAALQQQRAATAERKQAATVQRARQETATAERKQATAVQRTRQEEALRAQQEQAVKQIVGGLIQGIANGIPRH